MVRDIAARGLLLLDFLFLEVYGKGDVSHSPVRKSSSTRQVSNILNMRGPHNTFVEHGDIHEEFVERYILLCECTDKIVKLQARDCQNWLVVEFGIVETVQKMYSSRTGSSEADTKPACDLRVPASHKCRGFLMSNLDETNLLFVGAEGFHNAVDSVPRKTEDDFYAPI